MKKFLILMAAAMLVMGFAMSTSASSITGGDATSQALANDILDIVFVIDTSGSMNDDIAAIGGVAQSVITNLDCPECDVWVRARFMGIKGTGSIFDESVYSYVGTAVPARTVDHSEDNGWAVVDLVNHYNWNDDSTVTQDYYKAIVTIGDEGTDNGQTVNDDDWLAAFKANQAAINSGTFLFSWVTDDPYSGVVDLFGTMALGGSGGGYTFGNAGGGFVNDSAGTGDVETTLENIICTAGSGGTPSVPEPATILLLGSGLIGLGVFGRKKFFKK